MMLIRFLGRALLMLPFAVSFGAVAETIVEADFWAYGGTSGGVIAAVQAARRYSDSGLPLSAPWG